MKLLLAFALIALASSAGIKITGPCTDAAACTSCKESATISFGSSKTVDGVCVQAKGNCSMASVVSFLGGDCTGNNGISVFGAGQTRDLNIPANQCILGSKYECSPAAALQPVAWLAGLCALMISCSVSF